MVEITKSQVLTGWLFGAALLLAGCSTDDGSYTLYRASPIDPAMRIHVASFGPEGGLQP
jgi:hypothetical protein